MKRDETAFLLDLKALMDHAIFHQQSGTKLDMRVALNHAHQAVELTLRKKAELLGESPYSFPDIVKVLKDKSVRIPYQRQIEELNRMRILTQHYGTTPNENDARRLIFVARDFLMDFWKEALGIDYDSISLTELISDDKIRKTLKEAERADNHEERVIKSVLAIYLTKWWIKCGFYEEGLSIYSIAGDVVGVEDALDFVLDIALSSPFAYKLHELRKRTGIVFLLIPEGEPKMQRMKQVKSTREDADYALELAIEYALWAEQVYG